MNQADDDFLNDTIKLSNYVDTFFIDNSSSEIKQGN